MTTKPGSDISGTGVTNKPGIESGSSILNTFLTTAATVAGAEIGSQLAGRPLGVHPALGNPYGNQGFGSSGQFYPYASNQAFGNQGLGNTVYGNQPYGNRPFGNQPYGNRPYGNQPYGNQPYGNQIYGNQGSGNQDFSYQGLGNQAFGNQGFGYQGNNPSYGNFGNQGFNSGSSFGSGGFQGPNFGSGFSRPHHHHRPHHSHRDEDDDERRSSLGQEARNEPSDQVADQPEPVTGSEPDQKATSGAPSVDYIPIYWDQDPDILVFAPYPRETAGTYSATPTSAGARTEDLLSGQNPEYPENPDTEYSFLQVTSLLKIFIQRSFLPFLALK